MSKLSIYIGILLFVLGLASFLLTGAESYTALIPSAFGIVFFILGLVGQKSESMRKHMMHAALLLAILGLGGSFSGLIQMIGAIGGSMPERPAAAGSQSIMALLCIFFVIAGVKSFIDARKAPKPDTTYEDGPGDTE